MRRLFALALLILAAAPTLAAAESPLQPSRIFYEKGAVRAVENLPSSIGENAVEQTVFVDILSGPDQGQTVEIRHRDGGGAREFTVEKNEPVLLYVEKNPDGGTSFSIADRWRFSGLFWWILGFAILAEILVRGRGMRGVLALGLSLAVIFWGMIPAILGGRDPVFSALFAALGILAVNVPLVHGFRQKSAVIALGTFAATILTIGVIFALDAALGIRGTGTEEAMFFAGAVGDRAILVKIFAAGAILGALGAVLDVAVSIASGLAEIRAHRPDAPRAELFKSGMEIGADILGSMLNTLIFAYLGAGLVGILAMAKSDVPVGVLLNFDFVVEEIVRALAGSFGLLFAIPATAGIGAWMLAARGNVAEKNQG